MLGSPALHAKVGQAWWHDLSALLTRHFKEGHYTEGLIEAVAEAGPRAPDALPRHGRRPHRREGHRGGIGAGC
ncbi:MAG: hypothetical protein WDO13_07510 [Verrucomicrobiota bacterium]